VHFLRWDTVLAIREHQAQYADNLQALRKQKLSPERINRAMSGTPDLGHTWSDAYFHASRELAGTPAFGSPDAMKKSFRRVQRSTSPGDYFLPSEATRVELLKFPE
jgi:hypothetical protein